jgi:hypothetical protein
MIDSKIDPTRNPVKKQRITFVYNSKAYKIDIILNSNPKILLLRYQTNEFEINKPLPFVKIIKDVTRIFKYYIHFYIYFLLLCLLC